MSVPPRGRVVIVGGGPAGAASAVGLRQHGFDGEIVLIGAEERAPYSRPPLSKAFLQGEVSPGDLTLDTADAELRIGVSAVSIDADARRVQLAGGEQLLYDGLVLATGTTARRPSDPAVAVLQSMTDAEALLHRLRRARSVVVAGSGFLAFELASAARARGAETTLVHKPRALKWRYGFLADVISARAVAAGVEMVSTEAGRFQDGTVLTADSVRIEGDLVLAAIGATADTSLARHPSPLGFVTDDRCRLGDRVVAAGDAVIIRRPDGSLSRDKTWMNALSQGSAAARSLLDDDAPAFSPVPYGWTDVFGLEVKLAGAPPVGTQVTVVDGDLEAGRALCAWPGGAAAIGYRIPIARLRALATSTPATLEV